MSRTLILASGSLRRRELLKLMGLDFEVFPSDFDEYLDDTLPARELSIILGLGKARTVAMQYPASLVIGSDTIVTLKGKHLGKAKDKAEARQVLRDHGNEVAIVTTSVVLICKELGLEEAAADESKVYFKPTAEAAIEHYLSTGDWKDKAGSWGIQSGAGVLVHRIEGEYDTILGLPTKLLARFLQQQGVAAHPATVAPPRFG